MKSLHPKKGDLVYLPSDIMLIDNTTVKKWIKLDEPTLALMVEPQVNKNDIYHKFLFREEQLEKDELESLENKIYNHYKQYKKFNFNAVFDSKDPIKYITYLSHSKKKLLVNTNLLT